MSAYIHEKLKELKEEIENLKASSSGAKVTFEVDYYSERETLYRIMKVNDYHSALLEIQNELRAIHKYGDFTEEQYDMIGNIRTVVSTIIEDNGLEV